MYNYLLMHTLVFLILQEFFHHTSPLPSIVPPPKTSMFLTSSNLIQSLLGVSYILAKDLIVPWIYKKKMLIIYKKMFNYPYLFQSSASL